MIEPRRIVLVLVLGTAFVRATVAGPPHVKVEHIRRVFHNGQHNAFTDLTKFRGSYYLTFRSCPDGHGVNPTSSILVLTSRDGQAWERVYQLSVGQRDVRDPHFLVFQDKLFVYTGTWYCGPSAPKVYDINEHLGYGAWTADGKTWQGPVMLEGTYGHYVWRAARYGEKAYLCARRKREFKNTKAEGRSYSREILESAMLASDDGLIWWKAALFQETFGNETAFLFEPDGTVLGVARRGSKNAELVRSRPPYVNWERTDLGRYIGGPLLAKWGKHYLVGGRKREKGKSVTSLCWLVGEALAEFANLPSGGDTSYPGFVELEPGRALISYYSSHEKDEAGKTMTAIYLAELVIEQ